MNVPAPLIERARRLASLVLGGEGSSAEAESEARHLLSRLPRPAPEKQHAHPLDDGRADALWREYVAWVREKVWFLSAGQCEHCQRFLGAARGDLDHVVGGAYRDASTSIDGCRRLCRGCHRARTDNQIPGQPHASGGAAWWKAQFDEVQNRRVARHGPDLLAALRAEEMERLRAYHDTRAKPSLAFTRAKDPVP